MDNIIKLHYGDGGKYTNELITNLYYKYFNNEILLKGLDSGIFKIDSGQIAMTTDSFIVKPLFFPGGDIGKLAIYGTVNDLAVSWAKPLYMSSSFIIEEGFEYNKLEEIVKSMGNACKETGVKIITGDTKVVEHGSGDGIFINTTGIGIIYDDNRPKTIKSGDKVIITGTIGEHGTTIAIERYNINISGKFKSDCYPLSKITQKILPYKNSIKIMKDPTRGGLVTALNEISKFAGMSIKIMEDSLPIRNEVKYANDVLGFDPLYLASEGRMVLIVEEDKSFEVIKLLQEQEECREAMIIGTVEKHDKNMVYMETLLGGKRILNILEGPMLPRIC